MNLPSLILTGLLAGSCLAVEEKTDLAALVDYQANQLRKAVDAKRWTITQNGNSIRIESTFEMTKRRLVSPASVEPEKTKYCIDLRFEPQLPKEEYLKLAKERADHAVIIAYGAPTKDRYSDAQRFLKEHPLPRYCSLDRVGKAYSVYFTSTDSRTVSLGPVSLYAEARGVEGIVDSLLLPIAQ